MSAFKDSKAFYLNLQEAIIKKKRKEETGTVNIWTNF
jgi:hypothetical protein